MREYKFKLVGKEEGIVEITDRELEKVVEENICEEELVEMFIDWIKK